MPDTDPIARVTNNYVYEDFPVELRVGDEVFKVASSRLAQHSANFISINHQEEGKPIILAADVDEFKDFLWYIHADPFAAKKFFEAPPSAERCLRLLGIANVAYQYAAGILGTLALETALKMLTADLRTFPVSISLARRLIRVRPRTSSLRSKTCLDVICDAMYPSNQPTQGLLEVDPIIVVDLAQFEGPEAAHKDVLAHAYFYVLLKGDAYWKTDERLTAVDRQRLLCGSHALYSPHAGRKSQPSLGRLYASLGWAKAKVHADIAHRRLDLWSLFDHEPWRLPARDGADDASSTAGEGDADPARNGSAAVTQWLTEQLWQPHVRGKLELVSGGYRGWGRKSAMRLFSRLANRYRTETSNTYPPPVACTAHVSSMPIAGHLTLSEISVRACAAGKGGRC